MIELVGAAAATLTTLSFVPQVWRIWTSRSTRDISLVMYVAFATGVALWLAYGILLSAWPIIIANAVTLVLVLAVVVMKLRWG